MLDSGVKGKYAEKACEVGIERSVNDNVDFVLVRLRSKFREFPCKTFSGSLSVKDFKVALCQKSEIGRLEILRSQAHHLIVCAKKIRKALKFELHNFIYSSLQKVKPAVIEVLKQEEGITIRQNFDCCETQ